MVARQRICGRGWRRIGRAAVVAEPDGHEVGVRDRRVEHQVEEARRLAQRGGEGGAAVGADLVARGAHEEEARVGANLLGEGVAAAVAVKTGRDVAEIDIAAVQAELKRQDVRLW